MMNLKLDVKMQKTMRQICNRYLWDYLDEGFKIHKIEWAIDDSIDQFLTGLNSGVYFENGK